MFHDYRLRGGSGGQFSLAVTRHNYELSLAQLALESPDPNASRIIAKNLAPEAGGIRHRGGPLFGTGELDDPCDVTAAQTGPRAGAAIAVAGRRGLRCLGVSRP